MVTKKKMLIQRNFLIVLTNVQAEEVNILSSFGCISAPSLLGTMGAWASVDLFSCRRKWVVVPITGRQCETSGLVKQGLI